MRLFSFGNRLHCASWLRSQRAKPAPEGQGFAKTGKPLFLAPRPGATNSGPGLVAGRVMTEAIPTKKCSGLPPGRCFSHTSSGDHHAIRTAPGALSADRPVLPISGPGYEQQHPQPR